MKNENESILKKNNAKRQAKKSEKQRKNEDWIKEVRKIASRDDIYSKTAWMDEM